MAQWRGEKQFFLDETMRRHGLGDSTSSPECTLCDKTMGPGERILRCTECGEFLQCQTCCIARHQLSPLHFLKVCTLITRTSGVSH
jgi:hypothetical protein